MPSPRKQTAEGATAGISWVNPLENLDQLSDDDDAAGEIFVAVAEGESADASSADALAGSDEEQKRSQKKRSASAKPEVDALSPKSQAARDVARSKIAVFARQEEFGEVTLDEQDMDPDLLEHLREWYGLKHPRTKASLVYDVVQFFLLLYIVVWVPWRIAFELETRPDQFIFWWDIFVDLALVFDMFLCMHRYYFDDLRHKLITDPQTIRTQYL